MSPVRPPLIHCPRGLKGSLPVDGHAACLACVPPGAPGSLAPSAPTWSSALLVHPHSAFLSVLPPASTPARRLALRPASRPHPATVPRPPLTAHQLPVTATAV
ncbi:hypothetical protein GCM10017774_35110 [Lentzea cavernae]|uniref:Uncharacterized protein n=1 Tax=Lentzea cavernae TaxID=2020703 RepID=A0ABQ3MFD4_9PSEU|nr:hypothetical protein GCM10017774_35110 [Lentzea cavernae]